MNNTINFLRNLLKYKGLEALMKTENEYISLEINEKGGCLKSIYDKKRNVELLYQPLPDSWQGQDIFIFPFIARLKDGTYTIDDKEYSLKNHGLLRYMNATLSLEKNGDIKASFNSDEETMKQYPFEFKAYALYHLNGNNLEISYHIFNLSDKVMPFNFGAHPAFRIPGVKKADEFDISNNTIRFRKRLHLRRILQDEKGAFNIKEIKYKHSDNIQLSKQLFKDIPTLILNAENMDIVTLEKNDGSKLIINKGNAKYLAIWSDTKWGDYVAVEPWDGLPDFLDNPKDMYSKKEIKLLNPKKEYKFTYKITVC